MRKFLTALVVVALIATSVLCVACKSFEGSAFEALQQLQKDGKIEMEYTESAEYGAYITKITYDGLTMGADGYAMVYVNNKEYEDEFHSMGNNYTYNGEEYYASKVGISSITYVKGMKILIVYTEEVNPGTYEFAVKAGPALLFTLPDGVEKVTLD